ncbi:MAG: 23S rRNA (guanosine(2251)-2'-O)-methyltransferase RlmB [Christensenellaceae bacterium]|nr:23S rRNA (guanosine(2251)-2'-O)-methyltransferase RlmB [Christensenellaceae bacterium]
MADNCYITITNIINEDEKMLITGINAVQEALLSDVTIEKLYIRKGLFSDKVNKIIQKAKEKGVRVIFEEKTRLDPMTHGENNQGVIAETTEFKYTPLEQIIDSSIENKLIIILNGIEDPHNLGAILRVCESAGVTGVIIPERRSASVNDTVLRASAGAALHVPTAKVTNINDVIRLLKNDFVKVYAADTSGDSVYTTDMTGDVAVIIGGENNGVKELSKKLSDKIIGLPQRGKVNSLNASVAAGIIIYESLRQRMLKQ